VKYYRDFQVGDRLMTRGRTITEADIVMYAALSGDWYPLHVDAEYAKSTPFGERVAHGLLIVSVAFGLMPLSDMAILAVSEIEKIKFHSPTKIGDTIRAEMEILEKSVQDQKKGLITTKIIITNQRAEKVATAILKMLLTDVVPGKQ